MAGCVVIVKIDSVHFRTVDETTMKRDFFAWRRSAVGKGERRLDPSERFKGSKKILNPSRVWEMYLRDRKEGVASSIFPFFLLIEQAIRKNTFRCFSPSCVCAEKIIVRVFHFLISTRSCAIFCSEI